MNKLREIRRSCGGYVEACLISEICFFFSSRRRHTRLQGDWSSDVCSSDLPLRPRDAAERARVRLVTQVAELYVQTQMSPLFRLFDTKERDAAAIEAQISKLDRKSTRLNSSHLVISYAVFCLKKKKNSCSMRSTGSRSSMRSFTSGFCKVNKQARVHRPARDRSPWNCNVCTHVYSAHDATVRS